MSEIKPADTTILIASSSLDKACWTPVAENLGNRGYDVIVYEADKVADGSVALEIRVDQQTGLSAHYDGRLLDLGAVAAGWYRRPSMFSLEQEDAARQISLDRERSSLQYPIWSTIPEHAWLNAPVRMRHAENKFIQLAMARTVGFTIPKTVATNTWEAILKSLPAEVVFKPSYPMLYGEDNLKMVYTVPFENTASSLPMQGNPFPGIWQARVPKAREWRITIVGDETFDAAIYTDETARDDWRKHQSTASVQFRHGTFPDAEKERCFAYLGRFGLKFGAFDFVEGQDSSITFLECNTNGQFGWLEGCLDLPISNAIADQLVSIAKK